MRQLRTSILAVSLIVLSTSFFFTSPQSLMQFDVEQAYSPASTTLVSKSAQPLPNVPDFSSQDVPGGMFEDTSVSLGAGASQEIAHPGALSMSLHITNVDLSAGDRVRVSNLSGTQVHEYPGTEPIVRDGDDGVTSFWTVPVLEDRVVIEVVSKQGAPLVVDRYIRGEFPNQGDVFAQSGSCNVDVVCPQGDSWRKHISAVVGISLGGTPFCTGALVNNTAEDGKPLLLTAEHCGINAGDAPNLVAYFFYENSTCRTPGSAASGGAGDGSLAFFQVGALLRAEHAATDMSLLELDDPIPSSYEVAFLGWDRSGANATRAIAIHHPNGDEKRISFENDPTTITNYGSFSVNNNANFVHVADWDLGTTEPGSSGSPLLDQNGRVIGYLTGGAAACGNDASDWYGRLAKSWTGGGTSSTRLSDWLDPINSGQMRVDLWEPSSPEIIATFPSPGEEVRRGINVSVTFSEGVRVVRRGVRFVCQPGNVGIRGSVSVSGNTYTLDPNTLLPEGATCTLSIPTTNVTNSFGNNLVDNDTSGDDGTYRLTFTTNAAPEIIDTVPAMGATEVPLSTSISLTLSERVDVDRRGIRFACNIDGGVPGRVSRSGTVYTLTPSSDLPANAECILRIPVQRVTDNFGAWLVDNDGTEDGFYRLRFYTTGGVSSAEAEVVAPIVIEEPVIVEETIEMPEIVIPSVESDE